MSCVLVLTLLCGADVHGVSKRGDLATKLKQEKLWTDFELKEALETYLEQAKTNPSKEVVAVLVKHIEYDIYSYPATRSRLTAREKRFPVIGTLTHIGLPCVPSLIELLKVTDPEDENDSARRQYFAVDCLCDIYDKGGYGKEVAFERLKLAIARSDGREKKLLESAAARIRP